MSVGIYGLWGHGLTDSPSPALYAAAFRVLGRTEMDYRLYDLEQADFIEQVVNLRSADEIFVNVTMPYKKLALTLVDDLDDSAQQAGAVNLILLKNGRLVGYNTDGYGMLSAVKQTVNEDFKAKNLLLIGAGGAAAGIAAAALQAEVASIKIVNRDMNRAKALAASLSVAGAKITLAASDFQGAELAEWFENSDIVINCTPLGGKAHLGQVPCAEFLPLLHAPQIVADAVYLPLCTPFLEAARAAGCRIVEGYVMLIEQAIRGIELAFDCSILDKDQLEQAVLAHLA